MANKTLLMMYKKYGLEELCYRMRKKPYEIYKMLPDEKIHGAYNLYDVITDLFNNYQLPKTYKDYELNMESMTGTIYWRYKKKYKNFKIGSGSYVEEIFVYATPYWEDEYLIPIELAIYRLNYSDGQQKNDISYEDGSYLQVDYQIKLDDEGKTLEELKEWYVDFYLPKVEEWITKIMIPNLRKEGIEDLVNQ